MLKYGPPEHVFVETEWYDGPRAGIANVNGLPHRFASQWDEQEDEYLGTFLVWPVHPEELLLEQEQWQIFVVSVWRSHLERSRVKLEHGVHLNRGGHLCTPRQRRGGAIARN